MIHVVGRTTTGSTSSNNMFYWMEIPNFIATTSSSSSISDSPSIIDSGEVIELACTGWTLEHG